MSAPPNPTNAGWPGSFTPARFGIALLNFIASIHVVWFYLAYVPSELNLPLYENGLERVPFQHRMLMMFPLRWAHNSAWTNHLAQLLTAMPAWFPHGVHPEGIVEAAIDLLCVLVTGLVARSLYEASSPKQLLGPYVYPLTLLMIAATYCLNTMHRIRFVFDLPSMAFFAVGLYLLYFRRAALLFVVVFCMGTINRETTLFLLVVMLLTRWTDLSPNRLPSMQASTVRRLFNLQTATLLISLAAFWLLWRRFVAHAFLGNPSASGPRFWLNVGTLLWPISWPQILCTFAFCCPLCLAGRRLIKDRTLRAWYLVLPVWVAFMMRYGILIETRIFGELIPFLACAATLIAEQHILRRIGQPHTFSEAKSS